MSRAIRNVAKLKKHHIDSKSITIIIPAAGEGTRMKMYGAKSLINIDSNLTLIEHQIKLIRDKFPDSTIILISGYESLKVMNKTPSGIVHIENSNFTDTNISRSVAIGLRATLTNKVLIIHGDLIFNDRALNYTFDESGLFIDNSNTMTENEIGCMITNGIVENMLYDLPNKWAQISYFTNKELELLKKIVYNNANDRLFLFEVINKIIELGGKFIAVSPPGIKANDIDCSKDIKIAQELIL